MAAQKQRQSAVKPHPEAQERRLEEARQIARNEGLNYQSLMVSTHADKRFSILSSSTTRIHFGAWPAETFLDHNNQKKRQAWQARHLAGKGVRRVADPESALHYANLVLWDGG